MGTEAQDEYGEIIEDTIQSGIQGAGTAETREKVSFRYGRAAAPRNSVALCDVTACLSSSRPTGVARRAEHIGCQSG